MKIAHKVHGWHQGNLRLASRDWNMGSFNIRWIILISLVGFLVSRIIISYIKLQERDIGTMFKTINDNKVEVCV